MKQIKPPVNKLFFDGIVYECPKCKSRYEAEISDRESIKIDRYPTTNKFTLSLACPYCNYNIPIKEHEGQPNTFNWYV